ncbi:type I-B CRISPR-associated protein Cas7/Csh2 [Candidatus Parabeggiatoa sp. HSG14]|uniref:type I-B CRISPR-associated protein Cas7/Csh2 n=1 Tax=Candidatus Parabeggiatoa sp. HSG14 TaxID=3055593 RepID=UPI0025A7C7F5|nr:type I-B CRISPR-associated protein Cas7/Csh2 [Thiotrichales bacterium HSG14]
MSIITNRYEILFLYDCKDCNPNGDPLDENRPRTDPETGVATVTDVRIKRTIRDYFLAKEPDVEKRVDSGMEVLIRDTDKADGYLSEGKDRAEQFLKYATQGKKKGEKQASILQPEVLSRSIDARLFGAAMPLGKNEASIQITGSVQFSAFNRSLHQVAPVMVQQTAAFAGKKEAHQKSLAERWMLPYALIAAYGVVNEVAARTTQMTDSDLHQLIEALWYGTANLNTHSKIGHDPLLLVVAKYSPMRRIGALSGKIALINKKAIDTALRSTADYKVDVSALLAAFKACDSLQNLQVKQDIQLCCKSGDKESSFIELAKQAGLSVKTL